MTYINQGSADSRLNLEEKFLSFRYSWTFLMAPRLSGKSGREHDFDFGFYLEVEDYLVLGKLYKREFRNGLSLLTYFNAQSNDVGADRKIVFSEREIPEEVELLANTLKIEVITNIQSVISFLSRPLKKVGQDIKGELDDSLFFTHKKDGKGIRKHKKYRDRTRLIHEVLSSAFTEDGTTLNNLVLKCNLNYNSARGIIDDLIKRELISINKDENDKTLYKTTGSGSQIMEKLRFISGDGHND